MHARYDVLRSDGHFREKIEKNANKTFSRHHIFFSKTEQDDPFSLPDVKTRVESFEIGFEVGGDWSDS